MQSGFLYIMRYADRLKVGFSNDPDRRFNELKNAATPDLKLQQVFPTDNMAKAEYLAHSRLSELGFHIEGEVFEGPIETITKIVESSAILYSNFNRNSERDVQSWQSTLRALISEYSRVNEELSLCDIDTKHERRLKRVAQDIVKKANKLCRVNGAKELFRKSPGSIVLGSDEMRMRELTEDELNN